MQPVEIELDQAIYPLDCLNAAAYRLIGMASCKIEAREGVYVCQLHPSSPSLNEHSLKLQFMDLVTDERLRSRLTATTEPLRNLILSLAFGAIASEGDKRG